LPIILITGGARSGKSHLAQELARRSGEPVLFVATAVADDEEMRQRIEEHRKSRPANWRTLEVTTHAGKEITQNSGGAQLIIVDCITLLVNTVFNRFTEKTGENIDATLLEKEVTAEITELIDCFDRVRADFIIVTNEVGLGLAPANSIGRLYRDILGRINQLLAVRADDVYLMVSGLPLKLKGKPGIILL